MKHLTKPDGWTDAEWAEYSACEADYQDLQSQMQDRENAYERDDITEEQYRNWEYDYGPRTGSDDADTVEPSADRPQGLAEDIPEEVVKAYGLAHWPVRYGVRVASSEEGTWVVWGHAEERRVLAGVIADARADGLLDYLRDDGGLPGLLVGIIRRWVNNPRQEDDEYRWSYCPPEAEGAVAVTEVEPAPVRNPSATLGELFAARALPAASQALHTGLLDHARQHSGGSADWLAGYSEGAEHVLESLRIPGPRARRWLSLLPFAWPRPHTVTLCGSMRFFPAMLAVAGELTDAGVVVIAPFRVLAPADQSGAAKVRLDALHRRKIDMAHRVVVVTDESGYIGESTRAEITYAERTGKPVEYIARPLASESV